MIKPFQPFGDRAAIKPGSVKISLAWSDRRAIARSACVELAVFAGSSHSIATKMP
ncbi:hypothetical protein [Microcoleus sp. FACHB-831]|uniref:hypothetical protein n=1 Tax=Microcoleus sp. FACHB-831 TaxID=2692827 RepID=UPI001681C479|nr:hypothetical protein [Microcoleus sp. FACHB-831]